MPSWTEEDLQRALDFCAEGGSQRKAAQRFGVSASTLRRRIENVGPKNESHEGQQRLSQDQENELKQWILRQESLGYAPTHTQIAAAAGAVCKLNGQQEPLGKKWTRHFVDRHPELKTKIGVKMDYQRINGASHANLVKFFDLYDTWNWIKPGHRWNADEAGFMEGKGADGFVVGSSESARALVKSNEGRAWTSVIETNNAEGRVLDPLVIFRAKSIQHQWFTDELLKENPNWMCTYSDNGWTNNDIGLEWLEKIFIPQTEPADSSDARLLILDGHGSHTTEEFITQCFLNNIYLLFLPPHSTHVLQPLDVGIFSALKNAYRRHIGNLAVLTDSAPVGKLNFLLCYARARKNAMIPTNVKSSWCGAGLYPLNRTRALSSPFVVRPLPVAAPAPEREDTSGPSTPKRGQDVYSLLRAPGDSPETRLKIRKIAKALDVGHSREALQAQEIEKLKAKVDRLQPAKRKKVPQDAN